MGDQDDSSGTTGERELHGTSGDQERNPAELERQAREAIETVRASAGELGARVRDAMQRASSTWQATGPAGDTTEPDPSTVPPEEERRARALARRWAAADFLVEPELPRYMGVRAIHDAALWRLEVRERGETRSLGEGIEPYQGAPLNGPGPIQPVWDYAFAIPDIEAGERRERLAGTDMLGACASCSASGHQPCDHCEGRGFVTCAACHGRARISCRTCRGRGRVADPVAERRARASHSYWQVQAERLANDAALRLADFSERLRQEHGIPLPPSAQWVPLAPASGETIPCPDCVNGSVPCPECHEGKHTCPECGGSAYRLCAVCGGSGRAVRYREVVRRFDSRLSERTVPTSPEVAAWLEGEQPRRVDGEVAWEGEITALPAQPPTGTPPDVWAQARELAAQAEEALRAVARPSDAPTGTGQRDGERGERRVLERRLRVMRVPVTRVEYTFATHPFAFTAVGTPPNERFLATGFPPRWHRIGRFLRALARDVANETSGGSRPELTGSTGVSSLHEYRIRRMNHTAHRVRILADEPAPLPVDHPAEGEEH